MILRLQNVECNEVKIRCSGLIFLVLRACNLIVRCLLPVADLTQYLWGAKIYLKFIYLIMDP